MHPNEECLFLSQEIPTCNLYIYTLFQCILSYDVFPLINYACHAPQWVCAPQRVCAPKGYRHLLLHHQYIMNIIHLFPLTTNSPSFTSHVVITNRSMHPNESVHPPPSPHAHPLPRSLTFPSITPSQFLLPLPHTHPSLTLTHHSIRKCTYERPIQSIETISKGERPP